MILSKSPFIGPLQNVTLEGISIEIVYSTKCLGITIDNRLSWDTHTLKVSQSFSKKLKNLYKMKTMSQKTLSTIYFQGILPSVIYGILIWGNCAPNLMSSIEKIHIRAARFIHHVKDSVPDNNVLEVANWKPIIHYYKRNLACKTYKIYNNLSSPLLNILIKKSCTTRSTRNSLRLDLPSFKYVNYKRSFNYRVANVWNNLPVEIRNKPSFAQFKLMALKKSNSFADRKIVCPSK